MKLLINLLSLNDIEYEYSQNQKNNYLRMTQLKPNQFATLPGIVRKALFGITFKLWSLITL